MNDSQLNSIVEVKRFLQKSEVIEFKKRFRKEAYEWIEETLKRFDYLYLCTKEKGLIKKYIEKVSIFPASSYQTNKGIPGNRASESERI
jgi:hypothetical protein